MRSATQLILSLLLFVLPLTSTSAASIETKKRHMLEALDVIEQTFETMYAPAEWKKSHLKWDLIEQMHQAKIEVATSKNLSTKQFQKNLRRIFQSTKDYHVGIKFFSTEAAILPFNLRGAENRYFIDWIDPEYSDFLLQNYLEPVPERIRKDDELISVNNVPMHKVIQQLAEKEFNGKPTETDCALAAKFFPLRIGFLGYDVPKSGLNKILIKSHKTGKTTLYSFLWGYIEEEVAELPQPASLDISSWKKEMISPLFQTALTAYPSIKKQLNSQSDESEFPDPSKSRFPALGKKVWESPKENEFDAYIFEMPDDRRIGFVRIHSFYIGHTDEEFAKWASDFAEIIRQFEDETDALVIDQLDNPGGSIFYLYALASMLSDQPLQIPTHTISITQQDIFSASHAIPELEGIECDEDAIEYFGSDNVHGYPVDLDLAHAFLKFNRFLKREWSRGRTMTQQADLFGLKELKPHPAARYTRPILLLINELDFSGGDFFPAVLQDNQRATIMGSRTAGAGGYVLQHRFYNHCGIAYFNLTGSIAERLNGNPIENLGVTPDIPYSLTARDLQENFPDYADAVRDEIKRMLD